MTTYLKYLVAWERFCRWFKHIGFYIAIGILVTVNCYMYLERNDAQAELVEARSEITKLRNERREETKKYVRILTAVDRMDSIFNIKIKKLNDVEIMTSKAQDSLIRIKDTVNGKR